MTATMTRPEIGAEDIVFDIEHVTLRFGGVVSLNDVSLRMLRGEILAIIGPNGAGKTSLFNSLTGVYTPQEGRIVVSGRPGEPPTSVIGMKTHNVNHLGVARTFQNIRLFPALTCVGEREDRRGDAPARWSRISDARPAVATSRGEAKHHRRIRLARRRRAG
jgi:branched-chain amino acid transport system ATP-binding protein